jgi:hypothetical protein
MNTKVIFSKKSYEVYQHSENEGESIMKTWQVIGPEGMTWGLYNAITPQIALDQCASEKKVFKDWNDMKDYLSLKIFGLRDNKILLEKTERIHHVHNTNITV